MVAQEARQHRPQDPADRPLAGVDAHGAARRLAKFVDLAHRLGDGGHGGAQLERQPLAGIGQRHAARRAMKQAHRQPLLQHLDRMADRRRGHVELGGCRAKAAMRSDREEHAQREQIAAFQLVSIFHLGMKH